jgi:hypothetical protein
MLSNDLTCVCGILNKRWINPLAALGDASLLILNREESPMVILELSLRIVLVVLELAHLLFKVIRDACLARKHKDDREDVARK